jgi:hypothetical protein
MNFNFNFAKAFGYVAEASQALTLVAALPANPTAEDYANLGNEMALLFDPKLAADKNFQAEEKIVAAIQSAENGQTGLLGSIPLQSHDQALVIDITARHA